MKVKANQNIVEQSVLHKVGDIFEVSENRAKALGPAVEILEVKSVEEPAKDKMVSSPVKKKRAK